MGISFSSHSSVRPTQPLPLAGSVCYATGISNAPDHAGSPGSLRPPADTCPALQGLPAREPRFRPEAGDPGFVAPLAAGLAAPTLTNSAAESRAAQLRTLVLSDAEVVRMIDSPKDRCFDCAARVQCILNYHGIANATRGLFIWTGTSDELPENHFAVLVRAAGAVLVIDPTAAQFPGCEPMVATSHEWGERIAEACRGKAVLYRDYPNLAQARIAVHPLFRGSPLDFDGHALGAPAWYRRIVEAPQAFRAVRQRQADRDSADLYRRLRREAADLRRHPGMPATEVMRKLFPPDRHGLSRKV